MKTTPASSDLRAMFEVARRYLQGESSIQELNGAVSRAQVWAKSPEANPAVRELLEDWSSAINRRWNEWGLEASPLSESEFRAWLGEQLVGSA